MLLLLLVVTSTIIIIIISIGNKDRVTPQNTHKQQTEETKQRE